MPMASCCSATGSTRGGQRSPTPCDTSRFWSSCSRRSDARRPTGHAEDSMALLRIPDEDRTLTDATAVRGFLAEYGIEYERMGAAPGLTGESTSDEILAAWAPKVDELKQRGGY